jgi:hypothetical protein
MPVIRVIGGRVKKAINDIVALDAYFGLATVVIIHHTGKYTFKDPVSNTADLEIDCGLTHVTNEKIRAALKKQHPNDAEIDDMTFGEIKE